MTERQHIGRVNTSRLKRCEAQSGVLEVGDLAPVAVSHDDIACVDACAWKAQRSKVGHALEYLLREQCNLSFRQRLTLEAVFGCPLLLGVCLAVKPVFERAARRELAEYKHFALLLDECHVLRAEDERVVDLSDKVAEVAPRCLGAQHERTGRRHGRCQEGQD